MPQQMLDCYLMTVPIFDQGIERSTVQEAGRTENRIFDAEHIFVLQHHDSRSRDQFRDRSHPHYVTWLHFHPRLFFCPSVAFCIHKGIISHNCE